MEISRLEEGWRVSEIYHLLRAAFGQGVAIAQIVHFDVAHEVAVLLVGFLFQTLGGRLGGSRAIGLRWVVSGRRLAGVYLHLQAGLAAHRRAARLFSR